MIQAIGYATKSAHAALKPYEFTRPDPKANEVQIKITHCGICHSDVHQARNEWNNTLYPCMPGHEIIGRVEKTGSAVKKFKTGDIVGVGCMVDSCKECPSCKEGLEQYCESEKGFLATYNGNQRMPSPENHTYGGYSNLIVVREDFVLTIPQNLDPAAAGPILCAGVTTYSPLRHWGVKSGHKVGIIGLGGLGHMAVKLAKAMGAEVSVITTSKEKREDALALGAKEVILSDDNADMKKHKSSFDFILSTIPQPHDVNPYAELLKRDGVITIVGCIAPLTKPLDMSKLLMDRRSLGTSLIGGIKETQEVLDFCSKHNIQPNTRLVSVDKINEAFDEIDAGKIDFRYVIDMATLAEKHEDKSILGKIGITSH
ncbi:MAG: NAD(P)-dependent alcohol dehydrogenase [Chitinophagaceae bacterium]|nr:NAD(P)-dependent alcohol dehydrogenase [Oligoflexus sp.]